MAAGVAITLIVTATVIARSGGPTEASMAAEDARDAAAFIADYMRRAVREDHIMTSDPRLVRQFLAHELGLPIALITLEGFDIEGRRCACSRASAAPWSPTSGTANRCPITCFPGAGADPAHLRSAQPSAIPSQAPRRP
jgi:hypothetical protein